MTKKRKSVGIVVDVGSGPEQDRMWTTPEVSRYLGIPVATLHQWRSMGIGPRAYRVGRHLRYRPAEVDRWLEEECLGERSA